ncbi:MAG: DUF4402 domain-containing protein [Pseudomonadota bacterium]
MIKLAKLCAIVLLIGIGQSPAQERADSIAGAEIITPIMIMAWEELEFGTIAPDAMAPGTVVLSPAGQRICDTNLTCLSTYRAGKFSVTGEVNALYTISLPNSVTLESGQHSMQMEAVLPSHAAGILIDGYDEFMVGATLRVGANQSTGAYIGDYVVTVEYQ